MCWSYVLSKTAGVYGTVLVNMIEDYLEIEEIGDRRKQALHWIDEAILPKAIGGQLRLLYRSGLDHQCSNRHKVAFHTVDHGLELQYPLWCEIVNYPSTA